MGLFFRFLRVICSYDRCLYIPILCKSAHTARKTFRWTHKRYQELNDMRGTKVTLRVLRRRVLFVNVIRKALRRRCNMSWILMKVRMSARRESRKRQFGWKSTLRKICGHKILCPLVLFWERRPDQFGWNLKYKLYKGSEKRNIRKSIRTITLVIFCCITN